MLNSPTQKRLLERGLALEYLTLGWNVLGVGVLAYAAVRSSSGALLGFGLDSAIEIFASCVVIWQLRGGSAAREQQALRLIGLAFLALAAYLLVQTLWTVFSGVRAQPSSLGVLWLSLTVAVMLLLAWGKDRTGRALGNRVLSAEARVTLIDALLAASVLVGLVLNAALGWWWADPLSSAVILLYALREGFAHWREGGV